MKLLLLLVTGTSAATVQYVRNLCAREAGDGSRGSNFPLDKCMPLNRSELCKGTGGFANPTGVSWPGDTEGDILKFSSQDWRVLFTTSGNQLSVALYEAANCDGTAHAWAPAAIDFGSANGTTAGYYLEDCITAADGSGCVSVTLEHSSAAGCATVDGRMEAFVFPYGNDINDIKDVCTAAHNVSFACGADGNVDILVWNSSGAETDTPCGGSGGSGTLTLSATNTVPNMAAGSCSPDCSDGTMSTEDTAGVCTGATPDNWYSLPAGAAPCAPGAATSGSNLASAVTGTLIGAAILLA